MKKLLKILLVLIMLYFLLRLSIKHFGQGHNVSYKLDDFSINEKLSINKNNEVDNYLITIKGDELNIKLQILEDFNKDTKILKKLYIEKIDNQTCVLPIFKGDKIITDIMCINNNIIINYNSLKGSNHELDNFANRMVEYGYDFKQYENNLKNYTNDKTLILYRDNIVDNHFIALNSYRGIITINFKEKDINNIKLFNKDIYDVSLAYGLNNKYIIFDYNDKYQFNKIHIIDIVSNKKKTIKTNYKISKNSKVIGSYKNSIYIIDYDNRVEYEINVKKGSIVEIGNKNSGYIVSDCSNMVKTNSQTILNKDYLMPNCHETKNKENYARIDLVGGKKSGYYYYYQKTPDNYKVYRSNVQNPKQKLYITTLDDIEHIEYSDKFIYYIKDNQINYYSDMTGVRTVLENSELEFNKTLNYHLYVKEG